METKIERLEIVNNLIEFISQSGRRFFSEKERRLKGAPCIAYMKIKNNRVYFVDDYTGEDVYAYYGFSHNGLSHGGTLWALICDFSLFIRTGKCSDGEHGYGGLYSSGWGHSDEIQQEIIEYAAKIGYLR